MEEKNAAAVALGRIKTAKKSEAARKNIATAREALETGENAEKMKEVRQQNIAKARETLKQKRAAAAAADPQIDNRQS